MDALALLIGNLFAPIVPGCVNLMYLVIFLSPAKSLTLFCGYFKRASKSVQ
jgi:hypothetical protein